MAYKELAMLAYSRLVDWIPFTGSKDNDNDEEDEEDDKVEPYIAFCRKNEWVEVGEYPGHTSTVHVGRFDQECKLAVRQTVVDFKSVETGQVITVPKYLNPTWAYDPMYCIESIWYDKDGEVTEKEIFKDGYDLEGPPPRLLDYWRQRSENRNE